MNLALAKRNDKRKLFVNDKTYDTLKTNYLDDYNYFYIRPVNN